MNSLDTLANPGDLGLDVIDTASIREGSPTETADQSPARHSVSGVQRFQFLLLTVFLLQFALAAYQSLVAGDTEAVEEVGIPLLEFAVSTLDAGFIPCGETWTGSTTLTNTGAVPVEVLQVAKSCGCTAAGLSAGLKLSPGETHSFDVRLEPGTKNGTRFNVVIVCDYQDPASGIRNTAGLSVTAVTACEESGVEASLSPEPDPLFQEEAK